MSQLGIVYALLGAAVDPFKLTTKYVDVKEETYL